MQYLGLTQEQVDQSPLGDKIRSFFFKTEVSYENAFPRTTNTRRRFRGERCGDDPYCVEFAFGVLYFDEHIINIGDLIPEVGNKEVILIPPISSDYIPGRDDGYCVYCSLDGIETRIFEAEGNDAENFLVLTNKLNPFKIEKIIDVQVCSKYESLIFSYPTKFDLETNFNSFEEIRHEYIKLSKIIKKQVEPHSQDSKRVNETYTSILNDLKKLLD